MRKFKQVKRKEIIFDLAEWNEVKRRAEQISMTTSEYIRRMAVNGKISRFIAFHKKSKHLTKVV